MQDIEKATIFLASDVGDSRNKFDHVEKRRLVFEAQRSVRLPGTGGQRVSCVLKKLQRQDSLDIRGLTRFFAKQGTAFREPAAHVFPGYTVGPETSSAT